METVARTLENERRRRAESFVDGYLPPDELVIDPSLQFHNEVDTDLDPVSYEVLRSKLWNVNWDHQETIRRVSGSQVVVYGYDFNTTIQTEDGAGVCFGPGNLFFGGCADVVVKWTLEHRSMNVGINEGDIFLQDDPWIGTNHQMDAAVYAPVFWEGKLFAWVYNVIHQRELGGVEPGGFTQQAHDVYAEPTFFPPMKLVDAGKVREDVVDAWVRRSRLAGLMTLELRSQIAGVEVARARVLDLVERYGAARVKGTMRKMIDTTASVVGDRLASLPDGEWTDTRYVSGAVVGDLTPYKYSLTVRKEGDRLTYSNKGTDPSVGSFNITAGVLRACITNSLLTFLCYDQYLCAAGLLEQVDFEFERGTITAAHHPAAVSTSLGLVVALVQAQYLNAKMLSTNEETAHHTFGVSGCATLIYNHTFGVDQYGNPTANFPLDGIVGGLGAFPWRDGLDHGGTMSSTMNPVGSVESMEREVPMLYLYRREATDSGGHGRWRGGACIVSAMVGHRSPEHYISSGGLAQSVTQGMGLLGGWPATGGTMWRAENTEIRKWLDGGRVPGTPDELREMAPDGDLAVPKVFNNKLFEDDVFEVIPNPGAGYGDPMLREAETVAAEVVEGRLTAAEARAIYGVDVNEAGELAAGHEEFRRERRQARLAEAKPPLEATEGKIAEAEGLALASVAFGKGDGGEQLLGCRECGHALAERQGNYRLGAARLELAMTELGATFIDPQEQVGHELIFRSYLCPGCGTALDGEVCKPDDPPVWDVRLAPGG
ncbi:MAG TPA: hydantoinase B/oxoprolinase family protein [Solirubrobacterales bacterium]|nr:hydantoinase B/oxoprolinase family protein [Solirubrobacterales bacterium]